MFRKVLELTRLDGGATAVEFRLQPTAGGRSCLAAMMQLKIHNRSSANVTVGIRLEHSPDGSVSDVHSTPRTTATLAFAPPCVVSGDSDASKMLGEYLHWVIIVGGGAGEWIQFEAFEMRKAF